jgi:hypothetical protein
MQVASALLIAASGLLLDAAAAQSIVARVPPKGWNSYVCAPRQPDDACMRLRMLASAALLLADDACMRLLASAALLADDAWRCCCC